MSNAGAARLAVRAGAALVVVVAVVTGAGGAGHAHKAGKAELLISEARVDGPAGASRVTVKLVDGDSGVPQPGYDVTVLARCGDGCSIGPVRLDDRGGGDYGGVLGLAAGRWSVQIRAGTGAGSNPAVPTSRVLDVTVSGDTPPPSPAGPGVPGEGSLGHPYRVDVRASRQYDLPSELYVPVTATVVDAATGRPVSRALAAVARPVNVVGEDSPTFTLRPTGGDGAYAGVVILPHGGEWTVEVTVREETPTGGRGAIGALLGRGALPVTVTGGVLDSPQGVDDPLRTNLGASGISRARSMGGLWLHTLLALGWAVCAAGLGLLAVPKGRLLLSGHGRSLADRNLDRLVRSTGWLTAGVVATGLFNLRYELAYSLPLSSDRAATVLPLPYARPYFAALAIKLALFAVMAAATIPLARGARRQAALAPAGRAGTGSAPPARRLELATVGAAGDGSPRLPDRPEPAGPAAGSLWDDDGDTDRDPASHGRSRPATRASVTVVAAGAPLLLLAVTVLKYLHLLIEAFKAR